MFNFDKTDFSEIDFKVPSARDIEEYSELFKTFLIVNAFGRLLTLKFNKDKPLNIITISSKELCKDIQDNYELFDIQKILEKYFTPQGWEISFDNFRGIGKGINLFKFRRVL